MCSNSVTFTIFYYLFLNVLQGTSIRESHLSSAEGLGQKHHPTSLTFVTVLLLRMVIGPQLKAWLIAGLFYLKLKYLSLKKCNFLSSESRYFTNNVSICFGSMLSFNSFIEFAHAEFLNVQLGRRGLVGLFTTHGAKGRRFESPSIFFFSNN